MARQTTNPYSLGGHLTTEKLGPEGIKARGSKGALVGAVNSVTRRAAELSPEDRRRIMDALTAAGGADEQS